jgi:hypothetical protein
MFTSLIAVLFGWPFALIKAILLGFAGVFG